MPGKNLFPLVLSSILFLAFHAAPANAYQSGFCTPQNSGTGQHSKTASNPFQAANNCSRTDGNRALTISTPAGTNVAPNRSGKVTWKLPTGVLASQMKFDTRTIGLNGDWRIEISAVVDGKNAVLSTLAGNSGWTSRSVNPASPASQLSFSLTCRDVKGAVCARRAAVKASIRNIVLVIPDQSKPSLKLGPGFPSGDPGSGLVKIPFTALDSVSGIKSVSAEIDRLQVASKEGPCIAPAKDGNFSGYRPCPEALSGPLSFDSKDFEDDTYELRVCASDWQGNRLCLTRQVKIENETLDKIRFAYEFENASTVRVTWNASAYDASFGCRWKENASGKWSNMSSCNGGVFRFAVVSGKTLYTVEVSATDSLGKVFLNTLQIDTNKMTKPTPAVAPLLDVELSFGEIIVSWKDERNHDYTCQLDGGKVKPCENGEFYLEAPASPKVYSLKVTASNPWGSASATIRFNEKGQRL